MDLILWRHAEAEDPRPGESDLDRGLTSRGRDQASAVAVWLRSHLPQDARILASPARRTRQTADALGIAYRIESRLAPGGNAGQLLTACGWPDAGGTVLIVGHQPTLGEAAALLLSGSPQPWTVRKGSLWWLRGRQRQGVAQVVLDTVITPDRVREDGQTD
ncbi:MAG: histidine phosphatase family protein [Proteobacteria bacterium]|nr:histidine phosphatase family protein [Pseudomonadota bacterium]HQR04007.1 histidine phosphatase family protein [Rhodocyclaceae bacterium]